MRTVDSVGRREVGETVSSGLAPDAAPSPVWAVGGGPLRLYDVRPLTAARGQGASLFARGRLGQEEGWLAGFDQVPYPYLRFVARRAVISPGRWCAGVRLSANLQPMDDVLPTVFLWTRL